MQGGGNQTGPPTKRGLDCLSSEREPSSRQVCHYRGLQSGRTGRHTIVLPAVLLVTRRYYSVMPNVNFRALRWSRRDLVLVAAAGPVMNIALAVVAALYCAGI
jgi:hypothetical protein